MKTTLFAALAVLSFLQAPSAHARLDETLQQCMARYGAVDHVHDNTGGVSIPGSKDYYFTKNGINIVITIFQGRAANMLFSKENDVEFSPAEIQALLAANKGSSSWGASTQSSEADETGKYTLFWDRKDGASATYLHSALIKQYSLVLQNKAYIDERNRILDAEIAEEKKAKAQGDTTKGF